MNKLHRNKSITIIQAEQMYVQESKVQMNYLTFQPDIRRQVRSYLVFILIF